MLAVVDRLCCGDAFRFTSVAPATGPLAEALCARGIDVRPLRIRDDAGRRLPREDVLGGLRDALSPLHADVVHANSLAMGRLLGALGDGCRFRRIVHLRDIIRLSHAAIADLNRNDRLIAVSAATRVFHVAQGMDAARTAVIYNGVDTHLIQPREKTGALHAKLGLPDAALLALTVGQIGLRKGQDVLAEAAVRLRDALPQLHYVIVGERNSAKRESVEFERALIRRFHDAGMGCRTALEGRPAAHFLGYRADVPRLMNEADLLVHPTHQEPLGRVLLEAAASGLPIVATNVGGTPEILTDGVSARLVPPGDADSLAAAIRELVISPRRQEFAIAARRMIEQRFSIDRAARELAAVWE